MVILHSLTVQVHMEIVQHVRVLVMCVITDVLITDVFVQELQRDIAILVISVNNRLLTKEI